MASYKNIATSLSLSAFLPLLSGCGSLLMQPKGLIGMEQRSLILITTALMLIVVVPVIVMTLVFAWKYRASNKQAQYAPLWHHSSKIEFAVWLIPFLIIAILATITWFSTHRLDPRKSLDNSTTPLSIEVVALDWKWLFIYPQYQIATVNQIVIPVDRAVEFKITSANIMNSFFIPALGSQIYAMAGMENRLNLIANEEGTFHGFSANYSGAGFSGMKFAVRVADKPLFESWVTSIQQLTKPLNWSQYQVLAAPSINHPVDYFAPVSPSLYQQIINQFMPMNMNMDMNMDTKPSHNSHEQENLKDAHHVR